MNYYKPTTLVQKIVKVLQLFVASIHFSPHISKPQEKHPSILMVVSQFDRTGGLEKQAESLAAALVRKGFLVTLLTDRHDLASSKELRYGFLVRRLPRSSQRIRLLASLILFFLQNRNSFRIVHAHGLTGFTFFCVFLAKRMNLPVLLKGATRDDFKSIFFADSFKHRLYRKWIRSVDRVIAISEEMEQEIYGCGIPCDRIVKIPNFVNSDLFFPGSAERKLSLRKRFSVSGDDFIYLYLGRLEKRKSIDVLLQAWQKTSPGLLWIVGFGPELERLKRLSLELNLSNIRFFEKTSRPLEYYQCANIFVLPSFKEGVPGALLEAMSCELGCICTRIGGITDVINDHENGLLTTPGSPEQLAEAMQFAAANRDRMAEYGKQARLSVQQKFNLSHISSRYLTLYQSLCRR